MRPGSLRAGLAGQLGQRHRPFATRLGGSGRGEMGRRMRLPAHTPHRPTSDAVVSAQFQLTVVALSRTSGLFGWAFTADSTASPPDRCTVRWGHPPTVVLS